jgi:hypothetical protein
LTGRENIFLNGAILGLEQREIQARFDEIVEFAGLHRFIDTPVKRYSSGMYVRLAFAVAAHIHADVMLVDEVLSVGDMTFQQKCMDKMRELRRNGVTIVFVSHNLWSVNSFCTRALLLGHGQIQAEGKPEEVINHYRVQERQLARAKAVEMEGAGERAEELDLAAGRLPYFTQIEILGEDAKPAAEFGTQDQMIVRCACMVPETIATPMFVVRVRRTTGLICCALANPEQSTRPMEGPVSFDVSIGPLSLVPDIYDVQVLLADRTKAIVYCTGTSEPFRLAGRIEDEEYSGVFRPPAVWAF